MVDIPTRPTVRQMDNYGADVSAAFDDAENEFFASGKHYKQDGIVNLLSNAGYFRIDTYENSSPLDIHYVVFFFNKKNYALTKDPKVFEVHGTLARKFIELHRNVPNINNYPIDNDRLLKADTNYVISVENESAFVWSNATNAVIERKYSSYKPVNENTLVAFTEEYTINDININFKNWKNVTLQTVAARGIGMPTQILLHETAGMKVDPVGVFKIPAHFCIDNVKDKKGNIYQMADIAAMYRTVKLLIAERLVLNLLMRRLIFGNKFRIQIILIIQ